MSKKTLMLLGLAFSAVTAQDAAEGGDGGDGEAASPCTYQNLDGCKGILDSKFVQGMAESMQRARRSADAAGKMAHAAELARAESVAARNAENAGDELEAAENRAQAAEQAAYEAAKAKANALAAASTAAAAHAAAVEEGDWRSADETRTDEAVKAAAAIEASNAAAAAMAYAGKVAKEETINAHHLAAVSAHHSADAQAASAEATTAMQEAAHAAIQEFADREAHPGSELHNFYEPSFIQTATFRTDSEEAREGLEFYAPITPGSTGSGGDSGEGAENTRAQASTDPGGHSSLEQVGLSQSHPFRSSAPERSSGRGEAKRPDPQRFHR
jgi:hypothetical protein